PLHARIAGTRERQFPEIVDMQPEVLARHCTEAGLVEKAVGYWLQAGRLAIERGAMTEAVAQLRKGLALLSGLSDGDPRRVQEIDLQIVLGQALLATNGYTAPEPRDAFARASE